MDPEKIKTEMVDKNRTMESFEFVLSAGWWQLKIQ